MEKLSERSLENLLIAVMKLKTEKDLYIQIPLEMVFTEEFMKQFPEEIQKPYHTLGSRSCMI
jgi:hypothetical protein